MKIQFNLLPEEEKRHLRIQKRFRMLIEYELHMIILGVFVVAGLFMVYFLLKSETEITRGVYTNVVEQETYKNVEALQKKFINTKQVVSEIYKLEENRFSPSELLILLSENIPNEISVDSIKTNDNSVVIGAVADAREDVIIMKDKLQSVTYNDMACIDNVSVSEAELSIPVDVFFTMTLEVNIECFK